MPLTANQLGDWVDRYGSRLALYAAQWTRDADDCVQEAFIELARQDELPVNPAAWLYRVVRHRAINANRSARRRADHERMAGLIVQASRSFDSEPKGETEFITRVLEQLDESERELIVLRIWSDLSLQQISELTGTSISTVHRRYVKAIDRLKNLVEPTCPENLNCPQN